MTKPKVFAYFSGTPFPITLTSPVPTTSRIRYLPEFQRAWVKKTGVIILGILNAQSSIIFEVSSWCTCAKWPVTVASVCVSMCVCVSVLMRNQREETPPEGLRFFPLFNKIRINVIFFYKPTVGWSESSANLQSMNVHKRILIALRVKRSGENRRMNRLPVCFYL